MDSVNFQILQPFPCKKCEFTNMSSNVTTLPGYPSNTSHYHQVWLFLQYETAASKLMMLLPTSSPSIYFLWQQYSKFSQVCLSRVGNNSSASYFNQKYIRYPTMSPAFLLQIVTPNLFSTFVSPVILVQKGSLVESFTFLN